MNIRFSTERLNIADMTLSDCDYAAAAWSKQAYVVQGARH